mgnify:FL=1
MQRTEPLDAEEEFAVERLCSWLSKGVGEDTVPSPLESLLDDSQRAYLLSFRDRSDGFRRQYVVVSGWQSLLAAVVPQVPW